MNVVFQFDKLTIGHVVRLVHAARTNDAITLILVANELTDTDLMALPAVHLRTVLTTLTEGIKKVDESIQSGVTDEAMADLLQKLRKDRRHED